MQSYLFLMVEGSVVHRFSIKEMFMHLHNLNLKLNGLQALCIGFCETKFAYRVTTAHPKSTGERIQFTSNTLVKNLWGITV